MSSIFLTRLCRLLLLVLAQMLIFNQVHLFGYVTPLVIGYMIVCFHRGSSRVGILMWSFVLGLFSDMVSNTAGMASAACTLVAMVQPALLKAFTPHDAGEEFTPSIRTVNLGSYVVYVLILMFILHAAFYFLDAFTLSDWPLTLLSAVGGSALATIIVVFIELLVRRGS